MTMVQVTRPEMVSLMTNEWNASVIERPRANWRRLNTVVVDQGDCEVDGILSGFHLLELYHTGKHIVEIETELENGDRTVAPGSAGMLNYNQPNVRVKQTATGVSTLQQIYIDVSLFSEVAAGMVKGDPDKTSTLGFIGECEPRLRHIALAILDEARAPSAGSDLYADLLGQQIAALLLRRRLGDAAKPADEVRPLTAADLARITDHIEADLAEAGGLDTLAALVGRDVYGFARAFKATTGEAPHQFLIQRRLDRSKHLLATTNDPLADIAYATGFASQSHMTATFSKHVGMPPGAYRKAAKA